MYVLRNTKECKSNKYYTLCVPLALVIQRAMRMCHIIICGFSRSAIFFYIYLRNCTVFLKKVTKHEMCFDFLYIFVRNISHSKKN